MQLHSIGGQNTDAFYTMYAATKKSPSLSNKDTDNNNSYPYYDQSSQFP